MHWTDGARPLAPTSGRLLRYGPLPGEEERGREAVGLARVRGVEGAVPFALRVVVADPTGEGVSTVNLAAGDPALPALEGLVDPLPAPSGFAYEANGELAGGGLELVRAEFAWAAPPAARAGGTGHAGAQRAPRTRLPTRPSRRR